MLRYLAVVPKAEGERSLLVGYRTSPAGDRTYDGEIQKILNSLAAA